MLLHSFQTSTTSVSRCFTMRLQLQQQIPSSKPTHNHFVTPLCTNDSRSQRLLPRDLHKTKISLTHAYLTTVGNTRFLQTGQLHVFLYSNSHSSDDFYQYTTDSRLSYNRRKYKIPQKRPGLSESLQKMSFGFPIKSHPIPKRYPYIYTGISISCLLTEAIKSHRSPGCENRQEPIFFLVSH